MSKTESFDELQQQQLGFYVYMLIDPRNNRPFYIGKGVNNRIFDHLHCALKDKDISNAKYEIIRDIVKDGKEVRHVVVKHRLRDEEEAYNVECSLIDAFNFFEFGLTNIECGHNAADTGLMRTDEIIRKSTTKPLNHIADDCMIININAKYKRGCSDDNIYEATHATWRIGKKRVKKIKYVLSEFRGLIIEVYEVKEWYPIERDYSEKSQKYGQKYLGYGFIGKLANDDIRNKYINKSIAKKKGQSNPVIYAEAFNKL